MEVVVKIFGSDPPCAKCRATEKLAQELAEEFAGKVKVVHLSALSEEADKYDILTTPTVVINDKVAFSGKVPSKEEFREVIKKEIER